MPATVTCPPQAVAVLSNCEVRDCGGAGLRAEEGSTLNLLNCQVLGSFPKKNSFNLDFFHKGGWGHSGPIQGVRPK